MVLVDIDLSNTSHDISPDINIQQMGVELISLL